MEIDLANPRIHKLAGYTFVVSVSSPGKILSVSVQDAKN